MALGARTSDVIRLVLKNGMTPALVGVLVGLIGAFALTRLMASLLFGVTPTDLATFATVALALLAVALFACFIPRAAGDESRSVSGVAVRVKFV